MITPTVEEVEERRRGTRRRVPVVVLAAVAMALSIVTPHVGVVAATEFGRSMFPASAFFLAAQAGGPAFGAVTDVSSLAAGLNLTYFGLSLQHLGLLFGVASCWVLVAPDVGLWSRRFALVAGWCLALSAPVVITGYSLMEAGGVQCYLGVAWVFALVAGAVLVAGARAARSRLDGTWYWSRPELNG